MKTLPCCFTCGSLKLKSATVVGGSERYLKPPRTAVSRSVVYGSIMSKLLSWLLTVLLLEAKITSLKSICCRPGYISLKRIE